MDNNRYRDNDYYGYNYDRDRYRNPYGPDYGSNYGYYDRGQGYYGNQYGNMWDRSYYSRCLETEVLKKNFLRKICCNFFRIKNMSNLLLFTSSLNAEVVTA